MRARADRTSACNPARMSKITCSQFSASGCLSRGEQNNPAKYPIYMPELCSRAWTRYSAKFVGEDIPASH